MSTTSKTSEYQLSQVEQNDVPSWISDYSADMAKIDAALANNRNNVSAKFSEDTDYIKGNYCIKDDVLYKFTDAKPAGAWDSSKVEAVTVEGELEAHATAISEQNVKLYGIGTYKNVSTTNKSLSAENTFEEFCSIDLEAGTYIAIGNAQLLSSVASTSITSWLSVVKGDNSAGAGVTSAITFAGGTAYPMANYATALNLAEAGSIKLYLRSSSVNYNFNAMLRVVKIK